MLATACGVSETELESELLEMQNLRAENEQQRTTITALETKLREQPDQTAIATTAAEVEALKHELAAAKEVVAKLRNERLNGKLPGVPTSLGAERVTRFDDAADDAASEDTSNDLESAPDDAETVRSGDLCERELDRLRRGELFRVHSDSWPTKMYVCVMPASNPNMYQLVWGKSKSARTRGGAMPLSLKTCIVQGLDLFGNTKWVGRSVPDSVFFTVRGGGMNLDLEAENEATANEWSALLRRLTETSSSDTLDATPRGPSDQPLQKQDRRSGVAAPAARSSKAAEDRPVDRAEDCDVFPGRVKTSPRGLKHHRGSTAATVVPCLALECLHESPGREEDLGRDGCNNVAEVGAVSLPQVTVKAEPATAAEGHETSCNGGKGEKVGGKLTLPKSAADSKDGAALKAVLKPAEMKTMYKYRAPARIERP